MTEMKRQTNKHQLSVFIKYNAFHCLSSSFYGLLEQYSCNYAYRVIKEGHSF